MDLHQLWTILSTPDNVPIVLLLFVVPFYTWYGLRQAFANDRLIAQLETDPEPARRQIVLGLTARFIDGPKRADYAAPPSVNTGR